jgi:subtilisin family serine protease
MFEPQKPDIAAYSHFLGNFGPGRPGGVASQLFDNGTSAASPVAAGVGALLMSGIPGLTPARLKEVLIGSAVPLGAAGWNADTGHGVINAAAAFTSLVRQALAIPAAAALATPMAAGALGAAPAVAGGAISRRGTRKGRKTTRRARAAKKPQRV